MISEERLNEKMKHNIIMESRSRMMITGVTAVNNFDEQSVSLDTSMGELVIKGSELKVDKLNVESGELNVKGSILGLVYSDNHQRGGFLSRIFK
ncbi:MAG: sporulation protein YabP [Acutalibacteraceae bacterium]